MRKIQHPSWAEFRNRARPKTDWSKVGLVLILDPGETTGWARFLHGDLLDCGQEPTGESPALTAELIHRLKFVDHPEDELDRYRYLLEHIVYEEYRIRGNKLAQHAGSEVVTIKHIGVIEATADQLGIPTTKQSAGTAKGFAGGNDEHLQQMGLYQRGRRHSNDAIRHGVYWLLFVAGRETPGGSHGKDQGQDQE